MPTLSVCMMVQNSEKTLPIALESLHSVYDELIIVDGGSNDSTCEIASHYGAKIVHSEWCGNHSQQRNVYLSHVTSDWVFVLDSDEFIDIETKNFLESIKLSNLQQYESDNFWISRKWISAFSKYYYITSLPHYPDFQRRLFKYNQDILYLGQIHESIHNFSHPGICLNELNIYHLDFFINDEDSRLAKVRKYSKIDPRDGARHFYLPDPKTVKIAELNYDNIMPSVQALVDSIPNHQVFNSQLSNIIAPEIKDDEFYNVIQQLVLKEDVKTVLEIGSSSGAGSTEAFAKGIRENQNRPTLFCMEVSTARFIELKKTYANDSFVKCYNFSSVSVENFPESNEVAEFYLNHKTNLNYYRIEQILGWLKQDIEYLKKSEVPQNGIQRIKEQNNIEYFDVVLIDGSEFTGSVELNEVYGAKYILLDDITTYKNYNSHLQLLADPNYQLLAENTSLRNGYSVFKKKSQPEQIIDIRYSDIQSTSNIFDRDRRLPIHFFTIVLNGEPFIKYHVDIFKQLPFKWHWHIIEGVADLKHDTGWSYNNGGKISDLIHNNGLSNDGTTEYLDELAQLYSDNITIYRKPSGIFWDGKREMVNEPLFSINSECLLWQIDADELWTVEQICTARQMFIDNPDKTAALYWCSYFVGENLMISTRNCYAQNPQQEWLRTWRYTPGSVWVAHEPPVLQEPLLNGQWRNIAAVNPFLHQETESKGLVFQHFAYTTPEQLQFKEQYYGYRDAVAQWKKLQQQTNFPLFLRDYFAWVGDGTQVNKVDAIGIVPIAQKDNNTWRFLQPDEVQSKISNIQQPTPLILIDGVFFQLYSTGIARVWKSLLEEWANTEFGKHLVVLDRVGSAPKIAGISYYQIPAYDYNNTDADREILQQACNELDAKLFISTYYTTPLETPSVFMGYDMIPEVLGFNLSEPMWQEKRKGIEHASAYITISNHTAQDLVKVYPDIDPQNVTTAHCGVQTVFQPATDVEIATFQYKYGINKPYFIIGSSGGYKNTELFLQAFAQLPTKSGFDIIITGGHGLSEANRQYTGGSTVYCLQLDDRELSIAYSGAIALVYPSKYEGFGLPIVEAFASACPVITCRNASIPEVAGDAVIYVSDTDVNEMVAALCEVQKPQRRESLIKLGLERLHQFSWTKMANTIQSVLIEKTLSHLQLDRKNLIIFPDWSADEESLGEELSGIFYQLSQHPDASQMTLIIDTNSVADIETANALISAVIMNLMMSEDLDITESLTISLTGELSPIQWVALLPKLHGKIKLELENLQVIDLSNPQLINEFQLLEILDLAVV
jgi:glycosyltransferase involved in cell wall biosynthesis